jgi:ATP-dependent Clp protease ATP-binding subunit ClpA
MRRAIQRLVQDPLALDLLNGTFVAGDTVLVDAPPDKPGLSFAKATGRNPRGGQP